MFIVPVEETAARHIATSSEPVAAKIEADARRYEEVLAARIADVTRAYAAVEKTPANELARRDAIAAAGHALRRELWNEEGEGFKKHAQDLHEALGDVDRALAHWSDPKSALDKVTIADPRRATIALTLRGAGPAQLASLAQHAIVAKDAVLAAAIIAELQPRPTKDRANVDMTALAEATQPEVVRQIRAHLDAAKTILSRGLRAYETIERPSSLTKIARGFDKRPGAPRQDPAPPAGSTPLDHIRAGFAARGRR